MVVFESCTYVVISTLKQRCGILQISLKLTVVIKHKKYNSTCRFYTTPLITIFSSILESPVSTPLSNQQTFVHIELLFLVNLWEVREHLFCLKYRCQRVYVCRHHYFDRHQFRRLSLAVEENDFLTVAQCSQGVLCIVQERPKVIRSS